MIRKRVSNLFRRARWRRAASPLGGDQTAKLAALDRSQAIAEFDLDGTILTVNDNFLNIFGYARKDLVGKHHSILVDPTEVLSPIYSAFWRSLMDGEFKSAEFRRIGKGGRSVWVQATYNPVLGFDGRPRKFVEIATDITCQTQTRIDLVGQISALHKSLAVIEFNIDGTIVTANENFLSIFGYRLEEIQNQHHRILVANEYAVSQEYAQFWESMQQGVYHIGEYKRIKKDMEEVYIQGTYNPVVGIDGKLLKIVKFASDVTPFVKKRLRRRELQAKVVQDLDVIAAAVAQVNRQTHEAANASTQVHGDIRSVSSGAIELSASASAISLEVAQASQFAQGARDQAKRTCLIVSSLNDETSKIGEVISLIQSVAAQTNMLAVNASIEAARAGEAGSGFSIVALEVKQLSARTRDAAQQISAQITAAQDATNEAVSAIESIEGTISALSDRAQSVSYRVVQQASVTKEIASSMQTAEQRVRAIHEGVDTIATAVKEIDQSAQMLRLAAR